MCLTIQEGYLNEQLKLVSEFWRSDKFPGAGKLVFACRAPPKELIQ